MHACVFWPEIPHFKFFPSSTIQPGSPCRCSKCARARLCTVSRKFSCQCNRLAKHSALLSEARNSLAMTSRSCTYVSMSAALIALRSRQMAASSTPQRLTRCKCLICSAGSSCNLFMVLPSQSPVAMPSRSYKRRTCSAGTVTRGFFLLISLPDLGLPFISTSASVSASTASVSASTSAALSSVFFRCAVCHCSARALKELKVSKKNCEMITALLCLLRSQNLLGKRFEIDYPLVTWK